MRLVHVQEAYNSIPAATYLKDKGVKCSQRGCAYSGMLVADVGEQARKYGVMLRADAVTRQLLAQIGDCIAGCLQHEMPSDIPNLNSLSSTACCCAARLVAKDTKQQRQSSQLCHLFNLVKRILESPADHLDNQCEVWQQP